LVAGPGVTLGKVLADKPKNGYSPLEVPEWTGLQALGLGCLTTEGFVPKQLKRVPNSPLGRRYLLQDGDLLMSRANTRELVGLAGRYRDIGSPCIYPDLMMKLHPDETQCLTSYLELVLQTGPIRGAVRGAARGTSESMVKISAAVVEALRVPLPSLERQGEIVEAVALVDRRIERHAAVAAKLRTTQQAVVEDLLTGRSKAYAA
jgi:type I restriction enzyme S subunit